MTATVSLGPANALYAERVNVNDVALVNHPRVESLTGSVTDIAVLVTGELQFVNRGSADSGVEILMFDLPSMVAQTKNRVLFFRQIPNPRGVPDIFQPVRVEFECSLPPLGGQSSLVVLNHALPDDPSFGARTAIVCQLDDSPPSKGKVARRQLTGVNALERRNVPRLMPPQVEVARGRHTFQVKLRFAKTESAPGQLGSLDVTVFRQAAGEQGDPEVAYVLVTAAKAAPTSAHAPSDDSPQFDVNFELSLTPRHRLTLLNPVDGVELNGNLPFYSQDLETH